MNESGLRTEKPLQRLARAISAKKSCRGKKKKKKKKIAIAFCGVGVVVKHLAVSWGIPLKWRVVAVSGQPSIAVFGEELFIDPQSVECSVDYNSRKAS